MSFSHSPHSDHSKSINDFLKFGYDVFSPQNVQIGKLIKLKNWQILPMQLSHNVKCYGFLIHSIIENKNIAYITDTTFIPNLNLTNIDLLIIECNYDQDIVKKCEEGNITVNMGYKNHLSLQQLEGYLKNKGIKVKNLVAYHLSNSGLIDIPKMTDILSQYCEKFYISKPNTVILI